MEGFSTTNEAIEAFLAENEKTKNSFAYELYEYVGPKTFLELMKRFSGKSVRFPKKDEFEKFLLGTTKVEKTRISEVTIHV